MRYHGPADGVFEGGGAKGIALVGALSVAEKHVTEWRSLAGTSAGAIVAALLAAGYRSEQLLGFLSGAGIPGVIGPVNLADIPRRRALRGIPVISEAVNFFGHLGLYSGDYFYEVMDQILSGAPCPVRTFGDVRASPEDIAEGLPPYRLQFIATDLTHRRALVIPQDLAPLGLDPDEVPIALGIRMSMAIPLYFEPVLLDTTKPSTIIVDGGPVSNFPIWIFDSRREADWPTFGFLLDEGKMFTLNLLGVGQVVRRLVDTSMGGLNDLFIQRMGGGRVVRIEVPGVRTTEFRMSKAKRQRLINRGRIAAERFFSTFDPSEYTNSGGHPLAERAQLTGVPS